MSLYLSEVNSDFRTSDETREVLAGIDRIGKQLEIDNLLETIIEADRRLQRQKRSQEVERARDQLRTWFRENIIKHEIVIDRDKADGIRWDRQNNIFADILVCAMEDDGHEEQPGDGIQQRLPDSSDSSVNGSTNGIPIGVNADTTSPSPSYERTPRAVLFPAHRAMLLRSEYFHAMFSSPFKEAQPSEHLPIVHIDCTPTVLSVVLSYLYTEQASFGLDVALDVLFAADFLMIEKLKVKAAMIISSLGNGRSSLVGAENPRDEIATEEDEELDMYEVVRAGWATRVHRLEEFGARYMAYRLERYIDAPEFKQLVRESAARIKGRQETDTVEIIDE